MIEMFREVARVKQKLSDEECMEILKSEPRGVLSLIGDDDYPYGMPMNFLYIPEDNAIYFHGGRKGHKIDSMEEEKAIRSMQSGKTTRRHSAHMIPDSKGLENGHLI